MRFLNEIICLSHLETLEYFCLQPEWQMALHHLRQKCCISDLPFLPILQCGAVILRHSWHNEPAHISTPCKRKNPWRQLKSLQRSSDIACLVLKQQLRERLYSSVLWLCQTFCVRSIVNQLSSEQWRACYKSILGSWLSKAPAFAGIIQWALKGRHIALELDKVTCGLWLLAFARQLCDGTLGRHEGRLQAGSVEYWHKSQILSSEFMPSTPSLNGVYLNQVLFILVHMNGSQTTCL